MTFFFTSDTHFGHENIISFCNRPWNTAEEMDEALIENWNKVVSPKDTIYHLGDFAWQASPQRLKSILSRLNGHKHLILGNHDKRKPHEKSTLWESVNDYFFLKKEMVALFHYPIMEWDCFYHGAIHLYGHTHKKLENMSDNSYHVGVDTNNYAPISLEEIKDELL